VHCTWIRRGRDMKIETERYSSKGQTLITVKVLDYSKDDYDQLIALLNSYGSFSPFYVSLTEDEYIVLSNIGLRLKSSTGKELPTFDPMLWEAYDFNDIKTRLQR